MASSFLEPSLGNWSWEYITLGLGRYIYGLSSSCMYISNLPMFPELPLDSLSTPQHLMPRGPAVISPISLC